MLGVSGTVYQAVGSNKICMLNYTVSLSLVKNRVLKQSTF